MTRKKTTKSRAPKQASAEGVHEEPSRDINEDLGEEVNLDIDDEQPPINGHATEAADLANSPRASEDEEIEQLAEASGELAESIGTTEQSTVDHECDGTNIAFHPDGRPYCAHCGWNSTIDAEVPDDTETQSGIACMECGEANARDAGACQKCGAPLVSEKLQELGATPKTVLAVAGALAEHATNASDAESVERGLAPAEEKPAGSAPPAVGGGRSASAPDTFLPLDYGPFNPDQALRAIFEKSTEIAQLQEDADEKKEWYTEAKKAVDKAQVELNNLIASFKRQRQQALNPSQPFLSEVKAEAPPAKMQSACKLEREGKRCHVCEEARARKLQPRNDSAVHPEHESHETVGMRAYREYELKPLSQRLASPKINVHLSIEDLETLDAPTIDSIVKWLDAPGPIPPPIFVVCCIADKPGTMAQCCTACGRVLAAVKPGDEGSMLWWPEGGLVGLLCTGSMQNEKSDAPPDAPSDQPADAPEIPSASEPLPGEPAADAPASEAPPTPPVEVTKARKPRSTHAKPKATTRRNPEAERKEQAKGNRISEAAGKGRMHKNAMKPAKPRGGKRR